MSLPLMSSQAPVRTIDPQHTAMLIGLGVFFWFVGVFIVRFALAEGGLTSEWTPLVYALVAVGSAPIFLYVPRMIGLADEMRLACAALMSATALMIDGCVVRWTPWIYAQEPQHLAVSAASLLWGAGVGLAIGYVSTPKTAR